MTYSGQLASDYVERMTDIGLSLEDIHNLSKPTDGMVVIVRQHMDHIDIHEFESGWNYVAAMHFVLHNITL